MKKIVSILLVIILMILLTQNVYASNSVSIESITLKEKSEDLIELSKPTINGMDLGFNLSFLNIGDKAKYEVIISNNTNKDYYIDNETKFNKSSYITYTYEFDEKVDKIKKNSKLKMYITIEYTTPVPLDKLVNGMYTEDNAMSIDLSDVILTNPNTYRNIIIFILIISILIILTIIKIKKKQKIGLNILLIGLLLIPITTNALEKITIKAKTKITIEEQRNILESRYVQGNTSIERDFWQYNNYIKTITFQTSIEEPDTYAYKFDVSEAKNNGIIAYLVENNEEPTYYDLYLMSNGYIYANPDSSYFLYKFSELNEINNIENYNTLFTTNMSYMFSFIEKIEKLDLTSLNTINVVDMSYMFANYFRSIGRNILYSLKIDNFNTSNVTNMTNMFYGLDHLSELNVSSFDTSKVTDMSYMFYYCDGLESLDLSSFNTVSVENMSFMFSYDASLVELDLSNFNTKNVSNMSHMFFYLPNITNIDLSNFDTSKVTIMTSMFEYCLGLKALDLSNFDTSSVTDMRRMFIYDTNLENIFVSNRWNTNKVTSSNSMFVQCNKLPNFNSSVTDKTNANTSSTGYLTLKS